MSIRENDDGTYAITAVQHVPEKEAIVDNGAHFDGDQSGTVNGVTPPAVQHLTAEVTADSGEYQVLARWDTPKVVKGVSFMLRLTVAADDGSERLVSTARTTETTYRFRQLALGNYRLTVRAVNARGQQGDPASVSFRIAAPAAPSRIELTPGYFQITATPHLAVYDPTVQFEFWFSEKRIADIRQVETTARYLGTALYWIAASINIKPGHDYYFYIRSVNTVGKSAFVEAVGQPSDDASGYLNFFKGEIGKTHLAQELWTQIDNGQLAPDLAEIRTSITNVSNEITQTVNKKLEDQSAAIQQIQKVQVDTNNNLNSMWAVKLQQMQDGRLYIAGIGAGVENTPDGMQSQVLLAADITVGECFQLARRITEGYCKGAYDAVKICYTRFDSMMTQTASTMEVLPLSIEPTEQQKAEARRSQILYKPSSEEVFRAIIPEYVAGIVYGAVCESVASELAARRTAMDAATKNAGEMIDHLNLYYNRARQAAITQEITEIVAGAEI